MKHLKLYIVLGILLCMALSCTITVKALAAGDGELPVKPEEQITYTYDITITPPNGWYLKNASIQVKITGDEWRKAEIQRAGITPWEELTQFSPDGSSNYTITANGTYTVRVTDPNGGTHEAEQYVECIDSTPPTVRAGIRDKLLHTEATDTQSGVAGIMVDGSLYTTLKNGALDLRISDYKNAGKTISVIALDNVGNLSDETLLDNPYYSTTPPDTSTPAPTSTPTIIYTGDPNAEPPSNSGQTSSSNPSGQSNQSGQSWSGGSSTQTGQTVTVTPEPVVVTPEPVIVTPEPTAEPVVEPAPTPYEGTGFRGTGGFITRDMLYDQFTNKLFVTVETREGGIFYLVIDYDKPLDEEGEVYETYFLNPVDAADLMAFLPETEIEATPEPEVCTCADKCTVGHIDTTCPICRVNMSECLGVEPTPEPVVTEEPTEEPEPAATNNLGGMAVVLLILIVAAGGAAIFYMKKKQSTPKPNGGIDLDDFEYADDDEDDEEEYPTEDGDV